MRVSNLRIKPAGARRGSVGVRHGLTSSTGVPSSTSSASTSSVGPSATRSRSADSPIGFGRPASASRARPPAATAARARRAVAAAGRRLHKWAPPGLRWAEKSSHTWLKPTAHAVLKSGVQQNLRVDGGEDARRWRRRLPRAPERSVYGERTTPIGVA